MFTQIIRTLAVAGFAAISFFSNAVAAQLTIDQIEQAWGGVQPQTVRFIEYNLEGTVTGSGSLEIKGPSRLYFDYDGSSDRSWIEGQKFHSQAYNRSSPEVYPLGPLSAIFRRNTNLRTGAVTHIGQATTHNANLPMINGSWTYIRAIDPEKRVSGFAHIYFDSSGAMVAWLIQNESDEINILVFRR